MMNRWRFIPQSTGRRIVQLCNAHFRVSACTCPLLSACDIEPEEGETVPEFTRRWEQGMAQALADFEKEAQGL